MRLRRLDKSMESKIDTVSGDMRKIWKSMQGEEHGWHE